MGEEVGRRGKGLKKGNPETKGKEVGHTGIT